MSLPLSVPLLPADQMVGKPVSLSNVLPADGGDNVDRLLPFPRAPRLILLKREEGEEEEEEGETVCLQITYRLSVLR